MGDSTISSTPYLSTSPTPCKKTSVGLQLVLAHPHQFHRVGAAALADGLAYGDDDHVAFVDDAFVQQQFFHREHKLVAVHGLLEEKGRYVVVEIGLAQGADFRREGVDRHTAMQARHP